MENHYCPNCRVPAAYLGVLGYYEYWRCTFCGAQISVDLSPQRFSRKQKRAARDRRQARKHKQQSAE